MRIHVQNPPDDPQFRIPPEMWHAATARAGDAGRGHQVSFGDTQADFAAAIPQAEALIGDKDVIRALLPCEAPGLRLVFVTNAGLDNLAPFDWLPAGVTLLNNRGTHVVKAGEFGIMALLMLANRVPAMVTHQRSGRWQKLWGAVLDGRRVTVIGLGALGGSVAAQAARFGMRVTGVRTRAAPHPACAEVVASADLDRVLAGSEFLVLACPLTLATTGLIDRRRMGLLPRGAGIVNIGRGRLLDQEALCDALDTGALGGAILDVFEPEPIPPGHRLWSTPNLIISPHTAADDPNTYNPGSLDIFFANLRALHEGRPLPNRFDTARGY
ncbi:MAG TPA: D-2-hydroxyacid dehydrogenase [Acetobacteraceae bacterium]|nr:D-2-hydroxyacid dehydrogenase [Acetobacteraceae bacterium]